MGLLERLLPDEELESIFALDVERLRALGKRGIIFDLDNTLGRRGSSELDERVLRLLTELEGAGFRIGVLSNSSLARRRIEEKLGDHPVLFSARKPRRGGFRRMLNAMGLKPDEVVMVGDQLFTDVWGAKRLGIYAILVQPLDPHEPWHIRLGRRIARLILKLRKLRPGCSR